MKYILIWLHQAGVLIQNLFHNSCCSYRPKHLHNFHLRVTGNCYFWVLSYFCQWFLLEFIWILCPLSLLQGKLSKAGFQTFKDSEFNLGVTVTQKWCAAKSLARAYNNAIRSRELHAHLRWPTQFYFWMFEVTCLIYTLRKSLITKSGPAYGLIKYKATIPILRNIFKKTSEKQSLFHITILLPTILVRNQIRNMLGGETEKTTFWRIKYKFRKHFIFQLMHTNCKILRLLK